VESTKFEKKDWSKTSGMEESFESLKERFTTGPILKPFDPIKTFTVETDVSDFASGAILSQQDEDR
jgi:hypothetical protein